MILIRSKSQSNPYLKPNLNSEQRENKQERVSFGSLLPNENNMHFSASYRPQKQYQFSGTLKNYPTKKLFSQKNSPPLINIHRNHEKLRKVNQDVRYSQSKVSQKRGSNNLFGNLIKKQQHRVAKNSDKISSCMQSKQTADSEYWALQKSMKMSINDTKMKQKKVDRPSTSYFKDTFLIRQKSRHKNTISPTNYDYNFYKSHNTAEDDSGNWEADETNCVNTSQASIQFDMNPYLANW